MCTEIFQMYRWIYKRQRNQRSNCQHIFWIIEKAREFQKYIYFCFVDYAKPLTAWITTNWTILKEIRIPGNLTCLLQNLYACQEATVRTEHETTNWFQIWEEYVKAVYCLPASLTYVQRASSQMPGWMKQNLESRLLGGISVVSNMKMTTPLWQKMKRN